MNRFILVVGAVFVSFVFAGQSFATVVLHDYDFDGPYGGSWNFGSGYVKDGALVFDAKDQSPYVQWKLPVSAGYDRYHFEYDIMMKDFVGYEYSSFSVFFDTPTVAVLDAFTDGSVDWRTHSPTYDRHSDISSYINDQWAHMSFDLDMTANTMAIYQDDFLIYNGYLGATSEDVRSIRLNLGLYPSYYSGEYSLDNQVWLDNVQLTGENAPVPEPATCLLFGTGIMGLAGRNIRRNRKIKNKK